MPLPGDSVVYCQPVSFDPEPEVELLEASENPYDLAVAAARTCYSPGLVTPDEVARDERAREIRDRVYDAVYEAGHHTTIQHPTFVFALRKVSRQFLWSFLHTHPFYNSEQVSQRYVEVRPGNFAVPPLEGADREIYRETIRRMAETYERLLEVLAEDVEGEYFRLYPSRRAHRARWEGAIRKRILESARCVLPVATHAHLYHTVNGLTLHRYHRLCEQPDAPEETRLVVGKMVEVVRAHDPLFFRRAKDPFPLEETPEFRMFREFHEASRREPGEGFALEFDRDLGPWRSRLVDWKANGETVMAGAVRSVLGLPREALSDDEAVGRVLDPARNHLLGETLVLTTLSKLSRVMVHPHYTFRRKLSHAADCQDQRHRMVPASRPLLAAQFVQGRPDALLPPVVERNTAARGLIETLFREVWRAIDRLLERGVRREFALYLLPNAFPIRYEESGDLLNLHHKWTTRLCYLAQEEIWRCCREEVLQVRRVHPRIGRHLGPPCALRRAAGRRPYCPEGARFCGVRAWEIPLEESVRIL